jgi:outer membrane protein assembly factor BamB
LQNQTKINYRTKQTMRLRNFVVIITLVWSHSVIAQEIAQWRGPHRDGIYPDKNLLKSWPQNGPELVLSVKNIGRGFSSPVMSNGIIYVTGMFDTTDYLTAMDMNGNFKWQVPYGRSWLQDPPDTRSTPTVEANRVYVVSGTGRLVCIDAGTGKEIWAVDVDKDYKSEWHRWGVAESPLIVDDKVVCTPGGKETSLVAFDKITGKLIWKSGSVGGQRSYVSPILFEYNSLRLILAMTTTNFFVVDPRNGVVQCSYPFYLKSSDPEPSGAILANTPVYMNDEIYITGGYNLPSVMLKLAPDGKSLTEKWVDNTLDNHHHGVVQVGGYIYGSNWIHNNKGNWVCLNWDTGKVEYESEWYSKGNIIYADGMLYLYEEKSGNVGLVKADPSKFEVISSFKVTEGNGQHWAHPAIFDGKLYIRHGDVLLVYNIKA